MPRTGRSILRLTAIVVLTVPLSLMALRVFGVSPMPLLNSAVNRLPAGITTWTGLRNAEPVVIGPWPPVKDKVYPDLVLHDHTGRICHLRDFAGRTILLELVAIPCSGCQALAGGNELGGFAGIEAQGSLHSIHHYAERYADVPLNSDDVIFVQLLLYGQSLSCPSQEEVSGWAAHFEPVNTANTIVLRGDASMLSHEIMDSIPGFHLIDEKFILRRSSCGSGPQDDLYADLLPELGRLVRSSQTRIVGQQTGREQSTTN